MFMKSKIINKKRDVKRSNIIVLVAGIIIVVLVNIFGFFFFGRLDLTEDKRYTLSSTTKKILKQTNDVVFVRCYLEGDISADFKRLRNETRELIHQFRAYDSDIEYEFVNPNSMKDREEQRLFYQRLTEKGLKPILHQEQKQDGVVRQYIFPYAEVTYKGRTTVFSLLPQSNGTNEVGIINQAIQNLEYNLSCAIRQLTVPMQERVAFLQGHGEWEAAYIWDFASALTDYYLVDTVTLNEQISSLTDRIFDTLNPQNVRFRNKYELLIVAKPQTAFSHKDLFILDQFVMRGGRVLWLVDAMSASMDSLQSSVETYAVANPTGLEEHLFHYGVRLNHQIIMDMQSSEIPVITGVYNDQSPQYTFFPWHFFPEISPRKGHIISEKISPVRLEIAGTMDTVIGSVRKTILLTTSAHTRILNTPALISLKMAGLPQDRRLYSQSFLPVAVLLEGKFTSVFKNRITPEIENSTAIGFLDQCTDSSAMIVVSDGDLVKNDFVGGQILPLGFDRYTKEMYGNKGFLLNCVNYLCGDKELIPLRSREIVLRKFNEVKLQDKKVFWQMANLVIPIGTVILFGIVFSIFRRKKYS